MIFHILIFNYLSPFLFSLSLIRQLLAFSSNYSHFLSLALGSALVVLLSSLCLFLFSISRNKPSYSQIYTNVEVRVVVLYDSTIVTFCSHRCHFSSLLGPFVVVSLGIIRALVCQEVLAKEPSPPKVLPNNIVLYQFEACYFCNKVKDVCFSAFLFSFVIFFFLP